MKTKSLALTWLFLFCLAPISLDARTVVGVTTANPPQLIQFDSAFPGTFLGPALPITGLTAGDTIQGIDFRPTTGVLYAVATNGTNGRIYTISTSTGVATVVGSAPFSTTLQAGIKYGIDFSPVSDRIRITNSGNVNLRVNPDDGTLTASDTNLNHPNINVTITGVAYDRNDRNPGTLSTLFGINFSTDQLVRIGGVDGVPSPNTGVVTAIGPLGIVTANDNIGFDIADDGIAYASMAVSGPIYRLYTMNLGTGAATLIGNIGGGTTPIAGIAVVPRGITNINTGETFGTIQAAINDAQTVGGHTIVVNAATFSETVTVSKAVTLLGARAGVDARSAFRGTQESIVRGANPAGGRTSAFRITVNGVVIDGFTIQEAANTTQAFFAGAGIFMDPNLSGTRIRNNIIQNNISGLYLSGNGPKAQTVIERNLFQSNTLPGPTSGTAIYSDQFTSGGTLLNVLINDNTFSNNSSVGVFLGSTTAASQSRVVISNNIFSANGNGLLLFNTADSVISRNQFTGSVGSQIVLGGGVNGLTLTENRVVTGQARGVRIGEFGGGAANANIVANCNDIRDNAGIGLHIDGNYTGPLDAAGNWWGSATGPTIASNPGGTGEEIVDPTGQVNFAGFLTVGDDQQLPATGFQCSPSVLMYGVDASNNLFRFNSSAPETILGSSVITGLQPGETILGIDFRPTTGELFALGRIASGEGRLYVIDPSTAAATLRAVLTAAPGDDFPYMTLPNTGHGVGFNPVPDLAGLPSLRVVNRNDQNFRINVANGQVTTDANINASLPDVSLQAAAYTNVDIDPATGTMLYAYDYLGDALVTTTNPNGGVYTTIGLSGVVAGGNVNFDIQTLPGLRSIPFISIETSSAPTTLFIANLTTGLMTPIGKIGQNIGVLGGLAMAPTGFVQFSAPTYSVGEAGPFATITINRVAGSNGIASVRFRAANGTATEPADFAAVDQVVTFNPSDTSENVNIPLVNDGDDEANETISLSLVTEPTGGVLLGAQSTAVLTINDDDVVQTVLTTQTSPAVAVGEATFDTASISGSATFPPGGTITFQLFGPNDNTCANAPIFTSVVPVNGNGNYISGSFTPTVPGAYHWVATYSGDGDHHAPASTGCGAPNQSFTATATVLGNISTRLRVETGDNALIAGFIVTGTQPKTVIVRGIGTSLPLSDKLADPTLELRDSMGTLLDSNDNWNDSPNRQAIIDSTIPPSNELESAILASLPANAGYTAILRGVNGGTGIGVIEAYDLGPLQDAELANISTRGFVSTDDNVLFAGTIVVGKDMQKVIVRAIGPSLSLANKMADPTLELRDGNGALIEANDNWVDSANKQAIIDSTIPPSNDFESAIVATLPGNNAGYTAIVRGANGTTGIAVVEIYALP